jgi:hypothetical protein
MEQGWRPNVQKLDDDDDDDDNSNNNEDNAFRQFFSRWSF